MNLRNRKVSGDVRRMKMKIKMKMKKKMKEKKEKKKKRNNGGDRRRIRRWFHVMEKE